MASLLGLGSSLYSIQVFNRYIGYGLDGTLLALTLGAILALILEFVFRRIRTQLVTSLLDPQDAKTTFGVFRHLLSLKNDTEQAQNPQFAFQTMKQQQQLLQVNSATNLLNLIDLPFACVFIFAIYLLMPALGLVVSIAAAGSLLLAWWSQHRSQQVSGQLQAAQKELDQQLSRSVSSGAVAAFNASEQLLDEFKSPLSSWMQKRSQQIQQQQSMQQSTQLLSGFSSVAVIGLGAVAVTNGAMDIGSLIGANILAMRAMNMINTAARSALGLSQAEAIQQEINTALALPLESQEGAKPADFSGQIAIRGVTHSYDNRQAPFVSQFNLQVQAGDSIAICGSNGRGKSTIAKIILGLLEPQQGQVLADGIDIRQLNPKWWRTQIGYLPQEPTLINGSLLSNLNQMCWPKEVDEAELKALVKQCGLQALIDQHPDGLQQQISAGGVNFPLGIRKRIALARALMAKPKLLLLDEPHEGMDPLGRSLLSQVLSAQLKQGRTLVLFSSDKAAVGHQINVFDLNTGTYIPREVAHVES